MSELNLQGLDITNFRSIRGHIHAPLDAKVVLVHGENGAGKTSLLSAIELALTGGVQSLLRADPAYAKQLLHRSAEEGSVQLKCLDGGNAREFGVTLTASGLGAASALGEPLAGFFRERTFLPQSLLGQLLQIYQESGNDADSPLARFVGKLLGLDRLDTLEAGLKPFGDVRNVRKNVDGWLAAENEKARLDRLLVDQRKIHSTADEAAKTALAELAVLCKDLGLPTEIAEASLDEVARALEEATDAGEHSELADQQRQLGAIQREITAAQSALPTDGLASHGDAQGAADRYAHWEAEYGGRLSALRQRIDVLLPDASLPSDPEAFSTAALARLRTEQTQLAEQSVRARADIERHAAAQNERDVALKQRDTIDGEVALLSTSAGSLGSAIAELTSFITDDICPVCDRDFSVMNAGSLSDHVHNKVRTLSASAERLLTLGRSRSEAQVTAERLDRELETLAARSLTAEVIAETERRAGAVSTVVSELDGLAAALAEGTLLRTADVAARRIVTESQSRHVSLAAAGETLNTFALSIGAPPLAQGESFEAAVSRLGQQLAGEASRLEGRLTLRRKGVDLVSAVRAAVTRRQEVNERLKADQAAWGRADAGLQGAQVLRDQSNAIRAAVDTVRSSIIRREFNNRLNLLWRDLFVRLAPGEPFVPAFRIPVAETQRLQPKLITEHRDGGDAGGTPGAMLSAGNLNTAALTLFIALHLSVPKELPWLILDDPVQSMDDVHIAHFAALLRTLSKEHGRQVMIAVHDRQLFEYLKLELSPAFPEDSLLTLELSRGSRRDTLCVSRRFAFKEETALLSAA